MTLKEKRDRFLDNQTVKLFKQTKATCPGSAVLPGQ